MKTKILIIAVVILEMLFLGWTSFIDNQNLGARGESIFAEQNTISENEQPNDIINAIIEETFSTVTLAITEEGSKEIIERKYYLDIDYLDLENRRLTALLLTKVKDSQERQQSLKTLNNLTEVDVSNNFLSEFPPYFLKMKNLKKVFLGNNNIKQINSNGKSESINTLDLSNNELSSYSTFALHLPKLQYLNLSGNYNLKRISIQRGEFSDLKELNIKYTKLAKNSERIAKLYELLPNDVKIIY